MDRKLTDQERQKERNKKFVKYGSISGGIFLFIFLFSWLMRSSVKREDLKICTADRGTIEVSVTALGKIVPAMEEIINSPIDTRILEVYKRGGDSVEIGTPILKLDLQSTETDFRKLQDQERMKYYELEQLKVNNQTYLNDLAMKVEVEQMKLNRLEVDLRNERYLDSLGSGTHDKVYQAELAYNTGRLELRQLLLRLENERKVKAAELQVKELERNISAKSMIEKKRILEDAQIRSPRKGILTFINNQVGAQVGQGHRVAVVSDLSRFRVDAEISDGYSDRVCSGGKTIVKIGNKKMEGIISSITPISRNGVISFTVQLTENNNVALRSGSKVDVYVMNAIKEEVIRIANGPYYDGAKDYQLFVLNGDNELVRRRVTLGDCNFEYVEVLGGIRPGEKVVVSDMREYGMKTILKLK